MKSPDEFVIPVIRTELNDVASVWCVCRSLYTLTFKQKIQHQTVVLKALNIIVIHGDADAGKLTLLQPKTRVDVPVKG